MNSELKKRRAKAGLLLIGCPRFRDLDGPQRGSYHDRKLKEAEAIVAGLDFLDLAYPGIVYGKEDAAEAIMMFVNEKVDFVIAEFLSWSEDAAWIHFLRDCPPMPVIFVNAARKKMAFSSTLDEDDFIDYLCCGTLVGSLEGSGSVKRIPRDNVKIVMGTREEVVEKIRTYSRAAFARSVLRMSSIGLMANMNEAMWSTYMDNYDLFAKIGPEIHYLPYSDYGEYIGRLSDEEVNEYADWLAARYAMMPDVGYDKFIGCIKATLAIKNMARDMDIDVFVYNDIDRATFKIAGCRAGFYPQWFNDNVSVLVPEADIGAALMVYIMKLVSRKNVNFLEPFHIEDDYGTFAGGHAGPNDHNDPRWEENVLIARDVRFAKTGWKYAGAPFAWYRISPGMKTIAGLYEEKGRYKIICFKAESLPGEHLLATYSHSIFRPEVPVKDLFEQILRIGATQHYAVADGDWTAELEDFAGIMGFEFYHIK